jgi:hypothetical protein
LPCICLSIRRGDIIVYINKHNRWRGLRKKVTKENVFFFSKGQHPFIKLGTRYAIEIDQDTNLVFKDHKLKHNASIIYPNTTLLLLSVPTIILILLLWLDPITQHNNYYQQIMFFKLPNKHSKASQKEIKLSAPILRPICTAILKPICTVAMWTRIIEIQPSYSQNFMLQLKVLNKFKYTPATSTTKTCNEHKLCNTNMLISPFIWSIWGKCLDLISIEKYHNWSFLTLLSAYRKVYFQWSIKNLFYNWFNNII